jgi:serine/threonine-protein kinase PpkA
MTETEVTFNQYDDFAKKTGRILPKDEGWGRGTRPVIHVSRDDAQAYADWLTAQTGQRYRLPTAQEWEYGQRAGTTTAFWWQDQSAGERANCRSGCSSRWSKLFSSLTGPAGSYPANGFGLYDTAGNVAEWLYDCTRSVNACREGLVAGGSHRDGVKNLQSNYREAVEAHRRENYIGIRLVRDL